MLLNSASFASTISSVKPSLHGTYFKYPTINSKVISFDDIAQLSQNKVLVGAVVCAAIGQLSKPFTSKLLYGSKFDLMSVVQAGAFPSTHSSYVAFHADPAYDEQTYLAYLFFGSEPASLSMGPSCGPSAYETSPQGFFMSSPLYFFKSNRKPKLGNLIKMSANHGEDSRFVREHVKAYLVR